MTDPQTTALHADAALADLPDVAPPIRPATTFERPGDRGYRRYGDEATERLEAVLGAMEGGHAVVYPSGMAATAALLRHLRPRRVSLPGVVYHGTREFVEAEAGRGAWELAQVDELEAGDVRWEESPANPTGAVVELAALSVASPEVTSVVDSTFATPVLQQPLAAGVDFVMHSTTKFIAGHSDALGGVLVTRNQAAAAALLEARARDGAMPGSLEAWLTLRGVRTLPLRVERQSATALSIAHHLESRVERVWYPGLESHPDYAVAAAQMSAFGGVVAFEMRDETPARAVVDGLQLFRKATSLGGVESLAEYRRDSDPAAPIGLVRLSVGLEGAADLIADLDRGLARAP